MAAVDVDAASAAARDSAKPLSLFSGVDPIRLGTAWPRASGGKMGSVPFMPTLVCKHRAKRETESNSLNYMVTAKNVLADWSAKNAVLTSRA